ncbi:unnamed protein product [Linum tenue]|uniref:F-box domain-containing protein n=1 Tax=Linum tenue TaxID=586396 RepID=A0AAV0JR05_9ROSI|nr:unnamed protein product [Linum tenue]
MSLPTNEIPTDTCIDILTRLPDAATVARCRCVCKSWSSLLSDPSFLLKILLSSDGGGGDRVVMILALMRDRHLRYSLYSPETFTLLSSSSSAALIPLPWPPHPVGCLPPCDPFRLVGHSNGIFCLTDGKTLTSDFYLWNPTTSETKLLRRAPLYPPHQQRGKYLWACMFGFDPESNDFKVVRISTVRSSTDLRFTEVYSLRNDSWSQGYKKDKMNHSRRCLNRILESRDGKCYRWECDRIGGGGGMRILCYDLAKDALSLVRLTIPWKKLGDCWFVKSVSFCKGVLVAFYGCSRARSSDDPVYEMWALMEFGDARSWTKVADVPQTGDFSADYCSSFVTWGNNKCFFQGKILMAPGNDTEEEVAVVVFDLKTKKTGFIRDVEINRHELNPSVISYVPSKISLSNLD